MKRFKSVYSSFRCAVSGILSAIRQERNLRIHLVAACYVLVFQGYYPLERAEQAVLLLTIGLVLSVELLNTALERAVDLVTAKYHPLAGTAKDIAAGAVLVCAVIGLGVGWQLFGDWKIIQYMIQDLINHIWKGTLFFLSAGAGFWFIFLFGDKRGDQRSNKPFSHL